MTMFFYSRAAVTARRAAPAEKLGERDAL